MTFGDHDDPAHTGWKAWCKECNRLAAEVTRLTGIPVHWTDQEVRASNIAHQKYRMIREAAKKGTINYAILARNLGISKASVFRIAHGQQHPS